MLQEENKILFLTTYTKISYKCSTHLNLLFNKTIKPIAENLITFL